MTGPARRRFPFRSLLLAALAVAMAQPVAFSAGDAAREGRGRGAAAPSAIGADTSAPVPVGEDTERACRLVTGDAPSGTRAGGARKRFCGDQVILRLEPGASFTGVRNAYGLTGLAAIAGHGVYLARVKPGHDEVAMLSALNADPRVAWAELNTVASDFEGRPSRFFPRDGNPPVPTDAGESYGRALIGAADLCVSGSGVTVAVIDTGIDRNHPDLDRRAMRGWNAFTGNAARSADIGNRLDDDGDGMTDESVGHGTHVSGIVLQAAPGARVMPIRALNSDGIGQAFVLARGIYYAIDRGADVINLSLGAAEPSTVVEEAVADALDAGIVVVAAAGNAGANGPAEYPAAHERVISVGATNAEDGVASFSTTNPRVNLAAPGVEIASLFPRSLSATGYATWSGTSMAAPWVSGTAALLLEKKVRWGPSQVARRLAATARDIGADGDGLGWGRLDAEAAVGCR